MINRFYFLVVIIIFFISCDNGGVVNLCPDPIVQNPNCQYQEATLYDIDIDNLPSIDMPPDNPLTIEGFNLGRHLFYDPILSSDSTVSCATCHKQAYAFGDNQTLSAGVNGIFGERNVPVIINSAFQSKFDWDGRSSSLEEQAIRPIFNEIELHNNDWCDVMDRLRNSDLYLNLFCAAFGTTEIDSTQILKALAQFERALISQDSKFDRYNMSQVAFSPEELEGYNIFNSERGDCFHCHPTESGLFTSTLFSNNGLDSVFNDLGRYNITGEPEDKGKFKSPTLRNIEFSAPYMHDGRFSTIDEVINHYNSGGHDSPTVDPLMKYTNSNPLDIPNQTGLLLTEYEKSCLKAFLLTLSDDFFITNEIFSNPHN